MERWKIQIILWLIRECIELYSTNLYTHQPKKIYLDSKSQYLKESPTIAFLFKRNGSMGFEVYIDADNVGHTIGKRLTT